MVRKTRRIIFLIFVVLFFLVALLSIFYAQGYSFDWESKSPVLTGSIYLKSAPKDASIFINDKYKGETTKVIKRLTPEKYNVRISKEGYYDWEKDLEVESKIVTAAKKIILIKESYSPEIVLEDISLLSVSNDQSKIIYSLAGSFYLMNLADQSIYEIPASLPSLTIASTILWSPNNQKIILSFSGYRHYLLNLPTSNWVIPISKTEFEITNFNAVIKKLSDSKIYNIKDLSFHPTDFNKIYFLSNNNLFLANLKGADKVSSPLLFNILAYKICDDEILYLRRATDELYKTNLEASTFEKLFDIPFLNTNQAVSILNDFMFITNKNLYFFNPNTQVLEKIAKDVKETKLSDDGKKILWFSNQEIGIIRLSENHLYHKYDVEIIAQSPSLISEAIWYSETDEHIIFATDEGLKIVELDNQGQRNTFILGEEKIEKVFYNQDNKKLYILEDKNLSTITILD